MHMFFHVTVGCDMKCLNYYPLLEVYFRPINRLDHTSAPMSTVVREKLEMM